MDILLPIVIIVIIFIIFTVCGWCFKRKRDGIIFQSNTPVQHHIPTATPQVVPPYPMDARHPIPQAAMAPQPGFVPGGYQGAQYPPSGPYTPPVGPTPYPPQGPNPPYPPVGAAGNAPYPPTSSYTSPPSYSEAVGVPPTTEVYAKQAPYNPNY